MAREYVDVGLGGDLGLGPTGYSHGNNNWRGRLEAAVGNTPGPTGATTSTTRYVIGDIVVHNGQLWTALRGTYPPAAGQSEPADSDINDNVEPGGTFDNAAMVNGELSPYWLNVGSAGGSGTFGVRDEVTETYSGLVNGQPRFFRVLLTTTSITLQLTSGDVAIFLPNLNINAFGETLTQEIRVRGRAADGRETTLSAPVGTTVIATQLNGANVQLRASPPPGANFQLTGSGRLNLFRTAVGELEFLRDFVISSGNPRITDNVSTQNSIRLSTVDPETIGIQVADDGITTRHIADGAVGSAQVDATIATQADIRTAGFRSVSVQELVGQGNANNVIPNTQMNEVLTVTLPNGFNAGTQFTPGPANDLLTNINYNRSRDTTEAGDADRYIVSTNIPAFGTVEDGRIAFSRDSSRTTVINAYSGEPIGATWSSINTILIAPFGNQLTFLSGASVGDTIIAYINRNNWAIWNIDAITENVGSPSNPTAAASVTLKQSPGGFTGITGTMAPLLNGSITEDPYIVIVPGGDASAATFETAVTTSADAFRATVEPAIVRFNIDTGNVVFNPTNFTDAPASVNFALSSGAGAEQALNDIATALLAAFGSARRVSPTFPSFVEAEPIVLSPTESSRRFNLNTVMTQNVNHSFAINGATVSTTTDGVTRLAPFVPDNLTVAQSFDGGDVIFSTYTVESPAGADATAAPSFSFSFTVATALDFNATLLRIVGEANSARSAGITGAGSTWEAQVNVEGTGIIFTADNSVEIVTDWMIRTNHGVGDANGGGNISFPTLNVLSTGGRRLTGVDSDTVTTYGILTGVPQYPRNQPTAANSDLTVSDAIPYNVTVNRRSNRGNAPIVDWQPATVVRAVSRDDFPPTPMPGVTVTSPGMLNVSNYTLDNMTNQIVENTQFFDMRVQANEAMPGINNPTLRHLRIGGTIYDLPPAGDNVTRIEIPQPTTPLNAYAGETIITISADPDGGTFVANENLAVAFVASDASDTSAISAGDQTVMGENRNIPITFPNQTNPSISYTVNVSGNIMAEDGTVHASTGSVNISVIDARPDLTITPMMDSQDRRAEDPRTNNFEINFGTNTGNAGDSVPTGTLNAYSQFSIIRAIGTGGIEEDYVTTMPIPATGRFTLRVPKANDIRTDRYIVRPVLSSSNPNGQTAGEVFASLSRFLSYSYNTHGASGVQQINRTSTMDIADGQPITIINNDLINPLPIILQVPIEDVPIDSSTFRLIPGTNPANSDRALTGVYVATTAVDGYTANRLGPQLDTSVQPNNVTTRSIDYGIWIFGPIDGAVPPNTTLTYTIGGV